MESLVGERGISYDARGLAEPNAEAPKISEISDGSAVFDAKELSTRKINLELRWLIYEQTDITIEALPEYQTGQVASVAVMTAGVSAAR